MIRALACLLLLCCASAHAQTANLWIDTNGGTCTRQGTAATYSDAAACSSISAALSAASNGDTVRMKAGTYGGQSINVTKGSPGVTVIAESTTTISGDLMTHGAWYEIQNINASSWSLDNTTGGPGTNNITCRNCNFTGNGGVWWVAEGYSNISWIGGSLTNYSTASNSQAFAIWAGETIGGSASVTNVLVDGVTFDDIVNTGGDGNHFEVIRIDGNVNGITIRNSTFNGNNNVSTSLIFFSTFRGSKPNNVLLENNFMDMTSNQPWLVQMNFQNVASCQNFTYRYNTFKRAAGFDAPSGSCTGGSFSNFVWLGNIIQRGDCSGANTFSYNLGFGSSGSACSGTGNAVTTMAAMNFDTDGFRILSGSAAIDAGGTGGNCIATDIDGNSRPSGSACDAGAHEYGAGAGSAPSAPSNFRFTLLW